MSDVLSMWTLYDHPKDYPDVFIARRSEITRGGEVKTSDTIIDKDIEIIRRQLEWRGLTCLPRSPGDVPCIVEVWL